MIRHFPFFPTQKLEKLYSEKDGVPVKYVCTTDLDGLFVCCDIFFRETPHPEFGNRYFGLFTREKELRIRSAEIVEDLEFGMVTDDEGCYQYSMHRHDYKQFKNGHMIDGGRDYVKHDGSAVEYRIKNGVFVKGDVYITSDRMW